jgi:hypothetical protein
VRKNVGRFIVALLAAVVGVCLASSVTWAQATPPVTHLRVAHEAALFLDSLATEARDKNIENAGCVTAYSVRDSLITIERLGPAHYEHADSVAIYAAVPLCPPGTPTVHSHPQSEVQWDRPSNVDFETSRMVGFWALLLTVMDNGWIVRLY